MNAIRLMEREIKKKINISAEKSEAQPASVQQSSFLFLWNNYFFTFSFHVLIK